MGHSLPDKVVRLQQLRGGPLEHKGFRAHGCNRSRPLLQLAVDGLVQAPQCGFQTSASSQEGLLLRMYFNRILICIRRQHLQEEGVDSFVQRICYFRSNS